MIGAARLAARAHARAAAARTHVLPRLPVAFASSASSSPRPASSVPDDFILSTIGLTDATKARTALHYTTYALAVGLPAALLFGAPVSTLVDATLSVAIPLHGHLGMRSVLVDYVHGPQLKLALAGLTIATLLTTTGLLAFNATDVGLTQGVKELFVKQNKAE